jgi:hypothetical protein
MWGRPPLAWARVSRRGRLGGRWRAGGLVALVALLVGLACEPPRDGPPKVVLIGDSMAREARHDLATDAKAKGLDLRLDVRGQAAPCSQERAVLDALAERPRVVAVQWAGNARFTAGCTTAFEVHEVVAEYRASLLRIIAARKPGTTVALVGIHPILQAPWDKTWKPLDDLYRKTAADVDDISYVNVNPTIAPDRRFARTLPCNDRERSQGRCGQHGAPAGHVVVRDPDGFHFCPVRYQLSTGTCPVASPGAARYATAIVDRVAVLAR